MHEHDPIDRMLDDAFRSRPVPPMSRPSLIDVRSRARRRQTRRSGAMLGALAVVGVGGAVALASRDGGSDRTTLTPGDGAGAAGAPATTIACPTIPTTMPPTTIGSFDATTTTNAVGEYIVAEGDTPALVAQKFGISIDDLNAANAGTQGYDAFFVGLHIVITTGAPVEPTLPGIGYGPGDPCAPNSGGSYHCTGPLGTYSDGAQMFSQCVFWPDFVPTTTIMFPPGDATSTTSIEPTTSTVPCPVGTPCATIPASTTTFVEPASTSVVPCDFPPATSPVTTMCADGVARPPLVVPTTVPVDITAAATSTTSLP